MVSQTAYARFLECINKEMKGMLSGQPVVWHGGQQVDQYKGLASALAIRIIPFMKETYEATEFLFGYVPVSHRLVPNVFFQSAVLDIKGKSVPGVGNFGAVVPAPVPETYVGPYADWKHRLLPLSAFEAGEEGASKVFKAKVGWNPLLEAVNNDKQALKALGRPHYSTSIGNYKVKMDSQRLVGFVQLAPYKGHTLMTLESTPGVAANMDKPYYDFKDYHDVFAILGGHIVAHPLKGDDVGHLYLRHENAAMMELMTKQVDATPAPESTKH